MRDWYYSHFQSLLRSEIPSLPLPKHSLPLRQYVVQSPSPPWLVRTGPRGRHIVQRPLPRCRGGGARVTTGTEGVGCVFFSEASPECTPDESDWAAAGRRPRDCPEGRGRGHTGPPRFCWWSHRGLGCVGPKEVRQAGTRARDANIEEGRARNGLRTLFVSQKSCGLSKLISAAALAFERFSAVSPPFATVSDCLPCARWRSSKSSSATCPFLWGTSQQKRQADFLENARIVVRSRSSIVVVWSAVPPPSSLLTAPPSPFPQHDHHVRSRRRRRSRRPRTNSAIARPEGQIFQCVPENLERARFRSRRGLRQR